MICVQVIIKEMISHIGPKEPRFGGWEAVVCCDWWKHEGKEERKKKYETGQSLNCRRMDKDLRLYYLGLVLQNLNFSIFFKNNWKVFLSVITINKLPKTGSDFFLSSHLFFLYLFQKSKDSKKGPVVILSITYRGVKFIDAATKVMGIIDYWPVQCKRCCRLSHCPLVVDSHLALTSFLSSLDYSSRTWDQEHLMCRARPRWPLHICIHYQGSEERPPLLSCLQHCGSGE